MSKKYVIFCLLAIIALATFFRLWQIKTIPPGFYPDEAMNGNNAMEAWDSGNFKVFYPENNGREGLWINMIAPFIAVFGNEPWVPRTIAAIFGILTVLGLFLLTRELFCINPKSEIRNPKQYQNPNAQNPKWFGILNFRNWNLFGNWKLEIRNLKERLTSPEIFLLSWFSIMLIPTVISNEGIPHALRSLAVVPAVMIFAALGLEEIIKKISDWLQRTSEQFPEKIKQMPRIKKELIVLLFLFLASIASQTFNQYFFRWASNPNVANAFSENYVEIGKYLNTLAKEIPKYVIVNAEGVDVRGIPVPSQTVMYITKTFLPLEQKEKNIFYILPKNLNSFIQEVNQKDHFYITMLENDFQLYLLLKDKIPNLKMDTSQGLVVLYR